MKLHEIRSFHPEDDEPLDVGNPIEVNDMIYDALSEFIEDEEDVIFNLDEPVWQGNYVLADLQIDMSQLDINDLYDPGEDEPDPELQKRLAKIKEKRGQTRMKNLYWRVLQTFEKVPGFAGFSSPHIRGVVKVKDKSAEDMPGNPEGYITLAFDNSDREFGIDPNPDDDHDYYDD